MLGPAAALYRWALLAAAGLILLLAGIGISFRQTLAPVLNEAAAFWNRLTGVIIPAPNQEVANHIMGGLLMVFGMFGLYRGFRMFVRSLVEVLNPNLKSGIASSYVKRQQLARGPKVVAIGGGTGLSTLLRGLKLHTSNITAIVTVTDDGGSSGRLVQEMGLIPPGDIRACLVALADAEKLMTDLFQHRFTKSSGALSGHSIGNLLIAGFIEQAAGDVDKALRLASEVLAIRGRVIPSTTAHVKLKGVMEDGSEVIGETAIVANSKKIRRILLEPDTAAPHPDALRAIAEADLICMGPGSVYTSIIPNLIIPGIAEAIREAECVKAYVCNVMTQSGESDAFSAAEHLVAIQANVNCRIFDYVLVNTGRPTGQILEKYRSVGQEIVEPDTDRVKIMGYKPITGNYMSETDLVRHDPVRVAAKLMDLLYR